MPAPAASQDPRPRPHCHHRPCLGCLLPASPAPPRPIHIADSPGSSQLPPPPPPWEFQASLAAQADSVLASLHQSGVSQQGSFGRIINFMVRGLLLDQRAYRMAAEDEKERWTR